MHEARPRRVARARPLRERERSGRGQFVEAALYDCGVSLLHPHAANYFLDGRTPARTGNAHPNIYPYDCFPTATDPIFLAVGNNGQVARLAELLGEPGLTADAHFGDNRSRSDNRAALRTELIRLLSAFDCEPLAEKLVRAGVPCGPVSTVDRVLAHSHTRHRGMVVELGEYRGVGWPIKLSRTPASYRVPPPAFAQDTLGVLARLGIDAGRYREALPDAERAGMP